MSGHSQKLLRKSAVSGYDQLTVWVRVHWQVKGTAMSNHGTALSTGQFAEFSAAVIRNLPRNISSEVALNWGNNGATLKKVLAEALCPPEEIVKHLSKLKYGAMLAPIKRFVPGMFFGKNTELGARPLANFEVMILAPAKTVTSVPETQVAFCELEKPASDAEIQHELLENHIFEGVDSLLPFLAGLIKGQPGGSVGDLVCTEYPVEDDYRTNIFYVRTVNRVVVVSACWDPDDGEWSCNSHHLGDVDWSIGDRVFTPVLP